MGSIVLIMVERILENVLSHILGYNLFVTMSTFVVIQMATFNYFTLLTFLPCLYSYHPQTVFPVVSLTDHVIGHNVHERAQRRPQQRRGPWVKCDFPACVRT